MQRRNVALGISLAGNLAFDELNFDFEKFSLW
jgi:hypothetical protein